MRSRTKRQPNLEMLETRLAMSAAAPSAAAPLASTNLLPGTDTLPILQAFTQAYPSRFGNSNYNPIFDLNHNGQIGQTDGQILLHRLTPISRPIPLRIHLGLAPADQAHGPTPKNLGGATHHRVVTVLGHTTPGSLVFSGTGTLDARLHGPAYVADANGNFAIPVTMKDGINQFDVQVNDPFGRHLFRAFPILWLDFAAYEQAHPSRT